MFTLYKNDNKENGRLFAVIDDVREYLENNFTVEDEEFDDFLDDVYEDGINILGTNYDTSYVYKVVDKTSYDIDKNSYTQEIINNAISELERTGEATIGDYQIVEEDED